MIKIGNFARLTQVSVVTLRHYDDLGLLKPVSVDRESGYRYYSVLQLPRLNRILALKDLGLSLAQIEQVLTEVLSIEELRGMLKLKHAEVQQQLAEEQGRLARIAARLRQIELENSMSDYDVVLKTVPSMIIVSQKITIPTNDQVPAYFDAAFMAVHTHLNAQGAKDTGPSFSIWHQAADVYENEVVEAIAPIDRLIPETEQVKVYELPEAQVVSTIHRGSYDNFIQAHTALLQWIEANGYRASGTYREIYMSPPGTPEDELISEVQYPLEKV